MRFVPANDGLPQFLQPIPRAKLLALDKLVNGVERGGGSRRYDSWANSSALNWAMKSASAIFPANGQQAVGIAGGRLDLDDIRAQVREQAGSIGSRDVADLDNPQMT
jgi:hypothetical protein